MSSEVKASTRNEEDVYCDMVFAANSAQAAADEEAGIIEVHFKSTKGITAYLKKHGKVWADVKEDSSVTESQIKELLEKRLFNITFMVGNKCNLYITSMERAD